MSSKTYSRIAKILEQYGIANKYLQAAILGVIYKESNFIPQQENLNYTAKRILQVWPNTPPERAAQLEHSPEDLGDYIYGGKYGNEYNEGYKYRGRGFNQITFKDNYKLIGKLIGEDLVTNPDLLKNFDTAAKAAAVFFKLNIDQGIKKGKFTKFGVSSLADINNLDKALKVAIQTNAGLNTSFSNNVVQEGYNKAKTIIDKAYQAIKENKTTIGGTALLLLAFFLGYKYYKKKLA